jgi:capsular exopolysaccharide synthesis family protein
MERIQSAISKARAAREGKTGVAVSDSGLPQTGTSAAAAAPTRTAPTAAALTSDEAWDALAEIAVLPRTLVKHRIMTAIPGPAATPFDVIRTRLLHQMRAQGWKRLAITSPDPACGKTMMCLNLAFSLARQPDIRTLVMDLDLRRPSMNRTLELHSRHQFSKVLEGKADAAEHIGRFMGLNLAIGTNHQSVRNSAELLHSPTAATALAEIEQRYKPDLMIFDLPPLQVGDDVMAFARQVDCVLIVAAAGATTIDEVDHCERELASQTNILGVVLNKCRYLDRRQSYYDQYQ